MLRNLRLKLICVDHGKKIVIFVTIFLSQRVAGGPRQRLGKVFMDGPMLVHNPRMSDRPKTASRRHKGGVETMQFSDEQKTKPDASADPESSANASCPSRSTAHPYSSWMMATYVCLIQPRHREAKSARNRVERHARRVFAGSLGMP